MIRLPLCIALVATLSSVASAAFAQSPPAPAGEVPALPAPATPAPPLAVAPTAPPIAAPAPAPVAPAPVAPAQPPATLAPPYAAPAPPAVGYGPPGYAPSPDWGHPDAGWTPPRLARYSTPMFVSGILAVSLGGVGLIAGSVLYGSGASKYDVYCTDENGFANLCGEADDPDQKGPGLALLIAGGALAIGGIPLILVGGRNVPADQAPSVSAAVGPRGASLNVTF